jgi:hypothetical protein
MEENNYSPMLNEAFGWPKTNPKKALAKEKEIS